MQGAGDHLRDARWFRRNPGILCPLIDSPAPPPQVATPPPPRPRPGTGGGHRPPQPSLGCTKVRRGPPSVSTATRRAPPVAAPSLGPPRSSAPPPRPAPAWPVVGCARLCWGLVLLISCPRTHAAAAAPD